MIDAIPCVDKIRRIAPDRVIYTSGGDPIYPVDCDGCGEAPSIYWEVEREGILYNFGVTANNSVTLIE